jgi:hypothetical protein
MTNDWLAEALNNVSDNLELQFKVASFRCQVNEVQFSRENFERLKELLVESYQLSETLQRLLSSAILVLAGKELTNS